ncbi:hypothetical protein P7C73_g1343, partial [Tremellales sp. Uapishka_1]
MASYEGQYPIPFVQNGKTDTQPDDHPTTPPPTTPAPAPNYEAQPPPETFEAFLAQIADAVRSGGGLTVDENLYEELFDSEDHLGRRAQGSSEAFIDTLKHVTEDQVGSISPSEANCPVCLYGFGAILTEQEYALSSESFMGDDKELGLRRLPCNDKHLICGKCARRWLRLNNTCPLCRATLDPSIHTPAEGADNNPAQADHLLELFRTMFSAQPHPQVQEEREEYSGMYS